MNEPELRSQTFSLGEAMRCYRNSKEPIFLFHTMSVHISLVGEHVLCSQLSSSPLSVKETYC
jgi:hypothetical protein